MFKSKNHLRLNETMSWVTDVLLIFSLQEIFSEEELEEQDLPTLQNINKWLQENNQTTLDNLAIHTINSAKSMQSCIYGGAFNYLKVDEFIKIVKSQEWLYRPGVQLLIKDEQDEAFTMYKLSDRAPE
jgi:hypothetical protein